jgi:hypothetical protein
MCLLLSNNALTWEILKKRNTHGPRQCSLCCSDEESNNHFIMIGPYTKHVWKEVERIIGLRDV